MRIWDGQVHAGQRAGKGANGRRCGYRLAAVAGAADSINMSQKDPGPMHSSVARVIRLFQG